ncbi:CD40 ligand isoform X2 [Nerophis ophidion]|uniref:CD40 ligand isoform X2 n=1 Tax=Nerophis ophidion TaxID=159077 RepID=UPI002ADF8990|nr:CD40 ligand isoform X2 [Nerophis ophidion]
MSQTSSPASVSMINTYQSSFGKPPPSPPPPPLPPRQHGGPQPVVFMPPAASKNLTWFLVSVMILQVLLTLGGFMFLYHTERRPSPEGKADFQSSEKLHAFSRTLARMTVEKPSEPAVRRCYLQWDLKHSARRNINYFHRSSWLTILQPGDYLVVSRVTFSRRDPRTPLASSVKLRRGGEEAGETAAKGEETEAMRAYCSLAGSSSDPQMCTASQGEVMTLGRGAQLSVWVEDLSLVDYTHTATTFGVYKL